MVGTTISHYKVIEKIGQGGMGEVYRAEDTNLSRESLDEFRPTLSPAEVQRLLLRTYRWIQPQEPQWRTSHCEHDELRADFSKYPYGCSGDRDFCGGAGRFAPRRKVNCLLT